MSVLKAWGANLDSHLSGSCKVRGYTQHYRYTVVGTGMRKTSRQSCENNPLLKKQPSLSSQETAQHSDLTTLPLEPISWGTTNMNLLGTHSNHIISRYSKYLAEEKLSFDIHKSMDRKILLNDRHMPEKDKRHYRVLLMEIYRNWQNTSQSIVEERRCGCWGRGWQWWQGEKIKD